jgi:hypothetical protein
MEAVLAFNWGTVFMRLEVCFVFPPYARFKGYRDEWRFKMSKHKGPIALKEWASVIKALGAGEQIFMLRKGGIIEETRDFQLESKAFYLYPTYEHQRKELLKDAYQPYIDETLTEWSAEDQHVPIILYAEVIEDIEVFHSETLDRLKDLHIWTDHFAEERLKWRRTNPLHLLVLRVYKLEQQVEISILPEYIGCKSWIQLENKIGLTMKPVLDDAAFNRKWQQLKKALL